MFLLNSCLDQFSATSSRWHSFSRSYGVILPSSLTMLLPSALGFSPHPPVSVYGTGYNYAIAAFLGTRLTHFPTLVRSISRLPIKYSGFSYCKGTSLMPVFPFLACAFLMRPHISDNYKYWNFNQLSIDYVFRPRLRSRLTQSRSALLWKP